MASYKDILQKKSREWNCPDMMNNAKRNIAKIPFSSPLVNWATYGGVPRGRITEFFGAQGGGKSSSSIDVCGNANKIFIDEYEQKVNQYRTFIAQGKKEYAGPLEDLLDDGPKRVLYVDLEHTYDYAWAEKLGVSEDDIDIMQPPDVPAEQILQTVQELIETGSLGLVVIDSVPSLVTGAELEKKYGERTVSSLAGLMTIFMRKIVPILSRYDCTMILINQTRDNMDNPYVVNTPGGQAIKFYSALRMLFRLGAPVDFVGNELAQSAEDPSGYIVNVKLVKQKSAPFDRKMASYYLMAQSGIRPDFDFAKLAINKYGIIKKSGAWFSICDPTTGEIMEDADGRPIKLNGVVKVYDYLKSNADYYNLIRRYILADINGEEFVPDGVVPEEIESVEVDEDGNEVSPEGTELAQ